MDKVEEARKILGEAVGNLTDVELTEEITKFELLAESILDLGEKKLFEGKTLPELISNLASEKYNFTLTEDQ
jgi:hypothetical protein